MGFGAGRRPYASRLFPCLFLVAVVSSFAATGGTVIRSGDYLIHTFTANGTFTTTGTLAYDVLLVGGGGGGNEGGGGGGGFLHLTSQSAPAGSHAVIVGLGGTSGANGQNSSFRGSVAYGGGGGGLGGASGGGAYLNGEGPGGTANYGSQGYPGGAAETGGWCSSGGGGGAGGSGEPGKNVGGQDGEEEWLSPDDKGGDGGMGRSSSITGVTAYYGGGGGGTNRSGYGALPGGGTGGGGAGSKSLGVGGTGTNGLGGGGGAYAAGGSGTVIIRYYSAAASQTITFASIPNKIYGTAPFSISPSASSGLPVTVSVTSGPATISGNTVTITGIGSVTLTDRKSVV